MTEKEGISSRALIDQAFAISFGPFLGWGAFWRSLTRGHRAHGRWLIVPFEGVNLGGLRARFESFISACESAEKYS